MSREVRRVPLDFDTPIGETWAGYRMPEELHLEPCSACEGSGYSDAARHFGDLWYGQAPFAPEDNGQTPISEDDLFVVVFAERNVADAPRYYGTGPDVVEREARRLAAHWNSSWSHHLNQDDVDALLAENRLRDLTHTRTADGWVEKAEPPTPAEVNRWSLAGFGHDGINRSIVIQARCIREGVPLLCAACHGESDVEAYPGQRAAAEEWEAPKPPTGPGWQMWQTVSEGGPVSPVYDTPEGLATWMRGERWGHLTYQEALNWVVNDGHSIGSGAVVGGRAIDGVTVAAKGTTHE